MNLEETEEKTPEWLISGYIPKRKITVLAGDGGAGKTTIWCAIAAAVSSGQPCFLDQDNPFLDQAEPGKVLFFSSEDSAEYTLRGRILQSRGKTWQCILFGSYRLKVFRDKVQCASAGRNH